MCVYMLLLASHVSLRLTEHQGGESYFSRSRQLWGMCAWARGCEGSDGSHEEGEAVSGVDMQEAQCRSAKVWVYECSVCT